MNRILASFAVFALAGAASAYDFPPDLEKPAREEIWVTLDQNDAKTPGLPLPKPALTENGVSVFKLTPAMLPVLSQAMHDRFHRCGGFLAHESIEIARASTLPPAPRPAAAYTLDQQSVVGPLTARVDEAKIRATIAMLSAFQNRYYISDGGFAAPRRLRDRWAELAAKTPGASASMYEHPGWRQESVILTIPGTDKADEIVVLGGHLDSINGWGNTEARAPGADDNASGIAVLTEAARVLAESGWRPRRTVQFMGYAAEEVGLRGSQEIAARYAASGKKVVGVIQFDMSNYAGSGNKMFLLTDHVDAGLSAFTGKLIDAYAGIARGATRCGYACSDHASWTKKGFPAAMAFESTFDDSNGKIHTEDDTLASSGGTASHSVPFAKLAVAFAVELAKTAGGVRASAASATN